MKNKIIFLLILLSSLQCKAATISAAAHQKYPYTLLTDSYGILSDFDLNAVKEGFDPAPFLPTEGKSFCYIYWQCFSRESLTLNLKEMGCSSEDIGWHENYGDLKITASSKPGIFHEYTMRRIWPVSTYEKRFNLWIKLMKSEKYVCLEGSFFNCKDRVLDGKKQRICSWTFEKIKTKKGCDSYFEGECHSEHPKNKTQKHH